MGAAVRKVEPVQSSQVSSRRISRVLLMIAVSVAAIATAIAFNLLVDPYGVWGTGVLRPIFRKVDYKHLRIAVPGIIRIDRPETLLLGSSRMVFGVPIEQVSRDGVMNGALTEASLDELALEVKLALKNPQLKRIVWALDFFAFDRARENWCDPMTCARLNGDRVPIILDSLMSLDALNLSGQMLMRAAQGEGALPWTRTVPIPWPANEICSSIANSAGKGLAGATDQKLASQLADPADRLYRRFKLSPRQLALFSAAITEIKNSRREAVIFLPPFTQYEMEVIRQAGDWSQFQEFKKQIATLGTYWDFSGYNHLSREDGLFTDVLHVKPAVGNLLLTQVLNAPRQSCDSAVQLVREAAVEVNSANAADIIARQNAAMREATASPSRYSRVAAQALAEGAQAKQSLALP